MKNSAILSLELIFLILASLEKPQQSICSCICLVLAIINSKMVSGEFLGPIDLFGAQTLYIHEILDVIVVCKDKNLMLATFQILTLHLKCLDNSHKFAVMGLIPSLYRNYFSIKERYWMPLAQIGLSDNPIKTSSGS